MEAPEVPAEEPLAGPEGRPTATAVNAAVKAGRSPAVIIQRQTVVPEAVTSKFSPTKSSSTARFKRTVVTAMPAAKPHREQEQVALAEVEDPADQFPFKPTASASGTVAKSKPMVAMAVTVRTGHKTGPVSACTMAETAAAAVAVAES